MTTIVDMTCLKSSHSPILSNEETIELFNKLKFKNDESARDKLVYSNTGLVLSALKKFKNRGENINDLFQIGCIGLIKAVDRFDLARELKFSTYAVWTIDGEIKRYLRDDSAIRVNRSSKNMLYKINRAKDQFVIENGKEPTNTEIADKLGVKEKEITNTLLSLQPIASLSEPVDSDNGKVSLIDKIDDKKISEELTLNSIALSEAIKKLNEKEQKVISMRYFLDKTQAEIASEFGVSQVHISRLEKNAIKEMKKYMC
ncbi:MAG: sigG [Bacillales bacterium]|jgi:RNA polymerase sporulation-specific sigma factor|nr:sigG [Bacillales bacterium]